VGLFGLEDGKEGEAFAHAYHSALRRKAKKEWQNDWAARKKKRENGKRSLHVLKIEKRAGSPVRCEVDSGSK